MAGISLQVLEGAARPKEGSTGNAALTPSFKPVSALATEIRAQLEKARAL